MLSRFEAQGYLASAYPVAQLRDAGLGYDNDFWRGRLHVYQHAAIVVGFQGRYAVASQQYLAVGPEKLLWVYLRLQLIERRVEGIVLAFEGSQAHHTVADNEVRHIGSCYRYQLRFKRNKPARLMGWWGT